MYANFSSEFMLKFVTGGLLTVHLWTTEWLRAQRQQD